MQRQFRTACHFSKRPWLLCNVFIFPARSTTSAHGGVREAETHTCCATFSKLMFSWTPSYSYWGGRGWIHLWLTWISHSVEWVPASPGQKPVISTRPVTFLWWMAFGEKWLNVPFTIFPRFISLLICKIKQKYVFVIIFFSNCSPYFNFLQRLPPPSNAH